MGNDFDKDTIVNGLRDGGYSDAIKSIDKLVAFLYLLGRDHLTLGILETLTQKACVVNVDNPAEFSNDHLARYALELANRLDAI